MKLEEAAVKEEARIENKVGLSTTKEKSSNNNFTRSCRKFTREKYH